MPIKHAESGRNLTPEYVSWNQMKMRCTNPRHHAWALYGGRGITLCPAWWSFNNFLTDVGRRPTKQHWLDRIDTNGHYEPSNVRWVTPKESGRNRRTNLLIEIDGVTKCAAEWAEQIGVDRHVVGDRYKRGVRGVELLRPSHCGKPFATSAEQALAALA